MTKLLASVAIAALLSVAACSPKAPPADTAAPADTASTEPMAPLPAATSPAQDFATGVAYGDMLEIAASKAAQAKSTNKDVKAYATMLIRDHTAASAKLKALATNASLTLPETLDSGRQLLADNIANAEGGSGFDDKYLDTVIDAHEAAISKFEAYARDGADPALKQFATDTLPTLQAHFNRGKTIRDAVNRAGN